MRSLVKTLLAGTLVAIPLSALSSGAATSQTIPTSPVYNDQVQFGDVIANGTLDVVDPSGTLIEATTTMGNGVTVAVQGELQANVDSRQRVFGDVRGRTVVNLNSGHATEVSVITSTVANAATATGESGGVVIANLNQQSRGGMVRAGTLIDGADAGAGDLSAASQAVANTVGLGADAGHVEATITQGNRATVEAATGGALRYTPGSATFSGTAIANNVTASGVNGSSMLVDAKQRSMGDRVQGASFLSVGNGQTIGNAATAVGNNIAVNNQGGPLEVRADQKNGAYIQARAVTTADQFGSAVTTAYAVGNSTLAGQFGEELVLDNRQFNTGSDIDAVATSSGREGYDMTTQATAMGNAVTGFACSECGGVMEAGNRQTNRSNVSATTSTSVSGSNRSVSGTTTAVGNSATFYVTKSGDGG